MQLFMLDVDFFALNVLIFYFVVKQSIEKKAFLFKFIFIAIMFSMKSDTAAMKRWSEEPKK